MKKILQWATLVFLLTFVGSTVDARQLNCQSDAFSSLSQANSELSACIDECPGSGFCSGYCQAYYDLIVDDIMSSYAICMNSSIA